ncbi:MAG: NAD-dependent epimerase/dehydratase family protein [Bacteroidetes bacterium]|nr:MAG: NAD-dependent epimerase/dehydratase family protein [Bacteroidota bacterium]
MDQTPSPRVLVIGALGQVGRELTEALRARYGAEHVIASDLAPAVGQEAPYLSLDVTDRKALTEVLAQYRIDHLYNLAAILSAKGEREPQLAWRVNMEGLLSTLEAARHTGVRRIFWPSSIAVFGPHSNHRFAPQYGQMDPTTIYGISKLAGEQWCHYYHRQYGLDIRSLRYPGLIGYKALPGGGTTDYAVDIFHQAVQHGSYTCFLRADSALPMMYMPDAIRATIELMEAPAEGLSIHSSYNLSGMSFSPEMLANEIRRHIPTFSIAYEPDFRQAIADSWPESIDDTPARADWAWLPEYDLASMTEDMLVHIRAHYAAEVRS